MAVVVSLLRGVNVGGHKRMRMEALRTACTPLGLCDLQTYVQSGNLVFRTDAEDLGELARRIEDSIESAFGFRCDVIVRTGYELREAVARNPFALRPCLDPAKLLVTFLARDPGDDARARIRA